MSVRRRLVFRPSWRFQRWKADSVSPRSRQNEEIVLPPWAQSLIRRRQNDSRSAFGSRTRFAIARAPGFRHENLQASTSVKVWIVERIPVNDAGTAVGWAKKYVAGADHGYRAVRWDPSSSTSTELGNLGTSSGGSTNSFAYALNGSGTAVGRTEKYVNGVWYNYHAVRWDASGTVATELGQLGIDGYGSTALAVNDSGTAVGWTVTGPSINSRRTVAWKSDGVAIDLNTLIDPASGWTLTKAPV